MSLAGDVDRLSALPDDLLHLILTLVRDAKVITRTAALSRRWRRVWIHAQHLVLWDTRLQRSTESGRFVGFVDWVLAQRGDADIRSLAIRTLGDFVSSCCPRLRTLHISVSEELPQLALRSEALQELEVYSAERLPIVDVTAPNLGVLKLDYGIGDCSWSEDEAVREVVVRIAAPRLQEIGINQFSHCTRPDLNIHDLTSVRRLGSLRLNMHGQYYALAAVDVGLRLLEKCPSAEHVAVWLQHRGIDEVGAGEVVDLTSEGASPFASVRSLDLTVVADEFRENHLVPSVFALLLGCPRLRSLDIHLIVDPCGRSWMRRCFCDELLPWTDHREISLGSLEEVRIRRFTEADDDVDLVSLLFASSDSIRSMTLTLGDQEKVPGTVSLKRMMTEDDDDGTATVEQKLMSIPSADRGKKFCAGGLQTSSGAALPQITAAWPFVGSDVACPCASS